MARLFIPTNLLSDTRFAVFADTMKYDRRVAVGTLVLIWLATRERPGPRISYDHLAKCMPCRTQDRARLIDVLEQAGFVRTTDDAMYEVIDNVDYFKAMQAWTESGRNGGLAKARKYKGKAVRKTKQQNLMVVNQNGQAMQVNPNVVAWEQYKSAYVRKWGVEPIRNAKVNGQIAKVVKAIGNELAGPVLAFYVEHKDPLYIQRQHDVSLALRDISGLATQYRRGQAITRGDVRELETRDRFASQMQRLRGPKID